MKKLLLFVTLIIFSAVGTSAQEDQTKHFSDHSNYSDPHDSDMDERMKRSYPKQKYKDVIGKRMVYQFNGFGFEVIFRSDTLIYWKNLKTDYEETDISQTILLDPYTVLTAWEELDGSFVSLFSNFHKKEASFFIRSKDGSYNGFSGKIKFL